MVSIFDTLPSSWENELERIILDRQKDHNCKKAYICSPCRADTLKEYYQNIQAAKFYMYYAVKILGYNAGASHAYLPFLLNDRLPYERSLALNFGHYLLQLSNVILICGSCITSGMKGEIQAAATLRIPMAVYNEELFIAVRKLVTRTGASKSLVHLEREWTLLANSPADLHSPSVPNMDFERITEGKWRV